MTILNPSPTRGSFSIGAKFFLLFALAVLMSIPGFFVHSLATDRAGQHHIDTNSVSVEQPQPHRSLLGVPLADSYRSTERATKYITLFLGLVFLTYFLFELTTGKRVHAGQYALVGIAQTIFYLLLLSLAEHVGFDLAFLIAGLDTVLLVSINAEWIFRSRAVALRAFAVFTLLYSFIYVLLRLEDYALLVGSITSFAAVAITMYMTRTMDWYSSGAQPTPAPAGAPNPTRESWLD